MTRRIAFLIGLLIEVIAIFTLFIPSEILLANGTLITLKTVPVDPRDIFRGDYVALDYEVGQGLTDITDTKPVYVVLEKKDDTYERVSYSSNKPILQPGQVCLIGRPQYQRVEFPDISQYFVSEGTGHELEQARNGHRLLIDARVNSNCRAVIQGLRIGPEVPLPAIQPFENMPVPPPIEQPKPVPVK